MLFDFPYAGVYVLVGYNSGIWAKWAAISGDFPVIPCSVSSHPIRQTRGDRFTEGFSVVLGLKRALKNRKFPVNSLLSGNSVEQGSPMTASTATHISLM